MTDLVTKAGFARELQCSPSTLTALVEAGLPVHAGKIDREEALRWICHNRSDSAGGWGTTGNRGASIYDRAHRLLNGGASNQSRECRLLDEIRRRIFGHLPPLLHHLAPEFEKIPSSQRAIVCPLAITDAVECVLLSLEDDLPAYRWPLVEPDFKELARATEYREKFKALDPELERIGDCVGTWLSLRGAWGPECKQRQLREAKK
jgi:hypothetical protein